MTFKVHTDVSNSVRTTTFKGKHISIYDNTMTHAIFTEP